MARSQFAAIILAGLGLNLVLSTPIEAQFNYDDYEYWQDLCQVFVDAEKYEEALEACDRAIEIDDDVQNKTLSVWIARGLALYGLEQYEQAQATFTLLLEEESKNSLIWLYQCQVLLARGQTDLAYSACSIALENDRDWGNGNPATAWRLRASVDRDRARDEYQALRLSWDAILLSRPVDPTQSERLPERRRGLEWALKTTSQVRRRLQRAFEAYDRALFLEPNDSITLARQCEVMVSWGQIERIENWFHMMGTSQEPIDWIPIADRYRAAIGYCDDALAGNGNWGESNIAVSWSNRAEALKALGDLHSDRIDFDSSVDFRDIARHYEAAIASYEQALAIERQSSEYWTRQGILLQQLHRYEKALTSYERALEITPEYSLALVNQCEVFNFAKEYAAALESCEAALRGDGNWGMESIAKAWNQRSAASIGLGNYEEALESAERALSLYDRPVATRVDLQDDRPTLQPEDRPDLSFLYLDYSEPETLKPVDPLPVCAEFRPDRGDLSADRYFDYFLDNYRQALNNKATSLWYLKRYQEAETFSRRSLSPYSVRVPGLFYFNSDLLEPQHAAKTKAVACAYSQAWFNHGRILSSLSDPDSAVSAYERALDTYTIYIMSEPFDLVRDVPASERISVIDDACQYIQDPADPRRDIHPRHRIDCANMYLNLSSALWYRDDFNRASTEVELAAQFNPASFEVWYNYALILTSLAGDLTDAGDYKGARAQYLAAVKQIERARGWLSEADERVAFTARLQQRIEAGRIATLLGEAQQLSNSPEANREQYYAALKLVEEVLRSRPDLESALVLRAYIVRQLNRSPVELREGRSDEEK